MSACGETGKLYCEQEGIIEDAVERIMIEDNGVDSSDESSDIRKQSSVRSGRTGR
jgi:hypothetical protein